MSTMRAWLLIASLFVVLAVYGCGEEFSSGDSEGAGAGKTTSSKSVSSGQGGGPPMCQGFGDACTECMAPACPGRACGCWENPECTAISDCYLGVCPQGVDAQCIRYCFQQHPAGISDAMLARDCAIERCPSECNAMGMLLTACQKCAYESCAPQMNACLGDGMCHDYLVCTYACSDQPCVDACFVNFPPPQNLTSAIQQCTDANCTNCG
jgi:hypothetical protein